MRALLLITLLLLGGCNAMLTRATLEESGPMPTEVAIKQMVINTLKDPDSIKQYELIKGPTLRQSIIGRGWFVCVVYNSKNGFGGYTGATVHIYVLRDNKVVAIREIGGCWKD